MGTFDPTLSAFVPTKYLGSRNSSICVSGFDQASFIMATSSALFNDYNTSVKHYLSLIVCVFIEVSRRQLHFSPRLLAPLSRFSIPQYPNQVSNSTLLRIQTRSLGLVMGLLSHQARSSSSLLMGEKMAK